VGSDPIGELMEVDGFYGWSRRIGIIRSLFERKRSKAPYVFLFTTSALIIFGVGLITGMLLFEFVL
jgi:hypothetical protein